jgi:hypothetical protein
VNTIRIPRQGNTDTSRRIAAAVDDEGWQKFRVSMKGTRTATKLHMLKEYYEEELHAGRSLRSHVETRVDNYIKALSRGGQLYAGESLQTMLQCDWRPRIKRD